MAAIFGETKFFENGVYYSVETPCGSKISSKSLYLAQFSRYRYFCVLQFLQKIRKFKMAAIFGKTNIFLHFFKTTLQRYPTGKKFYQIYYLARISRYTGIFVFCNFCKKFENSKWPPFLARQNFFENWLEYSAWMTCV